MCEIHIVNSERAANSNEYTNLFPCAHMKILNTVTQYTCMPHSIFIRVAPPGSIPTKILSTFRSMRMARRRWMT